MDIVTLALCKGYTNKKIDALPRGFVYKGTTTYANLPLSGNTDGDCYVVTDRGNAEYVYYQTSGWQMLGGDPTSNVYHYQLSGYGDQTFSLNLGTNVLPDADEYNMMDVSYNIQFPQVLDGFDYQVSVIFQTSPVVIAGFNQIMPSTGAVLITDGQIDLTGDYLYQISYRMLWKSAVQVDDSDIQSIDGSVLYNKNAQIIPFNSGANVFIWVGTDPQDPQQGDWTLEGNVVALSDYGLQVEGIVPVDGTTFTVYNSPIIYRKFARIDL